MRYEKCDCHDQFEASECVCCPLSHLQDADTRVKRQPLLKVDLASRLLLLERPLRRKAQLARYPSPMASAKSVVQGGWNHRQTAVNLAAQEKHENN